MLNGRTVIAEEPYHREVRVDGSDEERLAAKDRSPGDPAELIPLELRLRLRRAREEIARCSWWPGP